MNTAPALSLCSPTDADLLQAFLADRASPAFPQLVTRHLPQVYSHARRLLRDPHRAEDASQTVFLLLAQNATALAHSLSIAGWLYKVTRYTCANLRRIDARRKRHEEERARMRSDTAPPPPADEFESQIDAILQKLPARDRELLLLRFLHDLSFVEIARLTHGTEAAVQKQIRRVLAKLRARFAARNLHLPASFSPAAFLTAKSIPVHLPAATTAAALAPSTPLLALAKGSTALMLNAQIKLAATLLPALILLTATTSYLLARPHPPAAATTVVSAMPISAPATSPAPAAPDDTTPDLITVHGTIFDPAGKPLPNATITVPSFTTFSDTNSHPVATTHSGPDGRYQISFHKADVSAFSDGAGSPADDRWKQAAIVASAPNLALTWAQWDHTTDGSLDLHLPPDENPIDATILDPSGKPAPNTTVSITSIHDFTDKQFEDAYTKGPAAYRALPPPLPFPLGAVGLQNPIPTDANGHFHLAGLGPNRWISLHLHGPNAALATLEVVTQPVPPHNRTYKVSGTAHVPTIRVFGNQFTYTASPCFSLDGTLRDATTHAPIPNAPIMGDYMTENSVSLSLLRTTSDNNGHYRIDGIPTGGKRHLIVFPNQPDPYLPRTAEIDPPDPGTTQSLDFEFHKGRWITGKVTDKRTGAPVCARIIYTTYLDNPHTENLPEFTHNDGGGGNMDGDQSQYETKPDGSYRVVAVPGPAIIGVQCYGEHRYPTGVGADQVPAYQHDIRRDPIRQLYWTFPFAEFCNGLRQLDIPESLPIPAVNFQLDSGLTCHATTVDANGKLLSGCIVEHSKIAGHAGDVIGPLPGSSFDITNLTENESRDLVIINMDKKLGTIFDFTPEDTRKGNVTISLQPLAELSGRCLDPHGNPAPHVSIQVESPNGDTVGSAETDSTGTFHCPVVPGAEFYFASVDRGPYFLSTIAKKLPLDSGESQNLGDIPLHPAPKE